MKKTIKIKYVDHDSTVTEQSLGPFADILCNNYNVVFTDNPDYLIYGPFGDEHLRYFDCVKIMFTGECICPDFNECDYAIGFDHIAFGDRYLRYPLWLKYGPDKNRLMENKHREVTADLAGRDFCSFVVSNDFADPMRDHLFDELSRYKQIASGGRYKNNIGQPDGVPDKYEFQKRYKFALVPENASHAGYCTEKLMEAFGAQTVPIYWGDPLVSEEFNPKSFIDYSRYDSLESFLEDIKRIDQDEEAYLAMLREPALLSEEYSLDSREILLEQFLCHIFDQDKEKAYRRNMVCWGKKYNDLQLTKKRRNDFVTKQKLRIKKIFRK